MTFVFPDPYNGKMYEISDSLSQFMDKYKSAGLLHSYLFHLATLADEGSECSIKLVRPIKKSPQSFLDPQDIAELLRKASTGEIGVRETLKYRRYFLEDANVSLDDLLEFEKELGVDISKLNNGTYRDVFGNKDNQKIAAAFWYAEYRLHEDKLPEKHKGFRK